MHILGSLGCACIRLCCANLQMFMSGLGLLALMSWSCPCMCWFSCAVLAFAVFFALGLHASVLLRRAVLACVGFLALSVHVPVALHAWCRHRVACFGFFSAVLACMFVLMLGVQMLRFPSVAQCCALTSSMCLHASSSLCCACRRWFPGALRPYVRWIDCVVIARVGYLPLCWDSFLSLGDARAHARAHPRGYNFAWEYQWPSSWLGTPGAQLMFGISRGPVHVWELQGPSCC